MVFSDYFWPSQHCTVTVSGRACSSHSFEVKGMENSQSIALESNNGNASQKIIWASHLQASMSSLSNEVLIVSRSSKYFHLDRSYF